MKHTIWGHGHYNKVIYTPEGDYEGVLSVKRIRPVVKPVACRLFRFDNWNSGRVFYVAARDEATAEKKAATLGYDPKDYCTCGCDSQLWDCQEIEWNSNTKWHEGIPENSEVLF